MFIESFCELQTFLNKYKLIKLKQIIKFYEDH